MLEEVHPLVKELLQNWDDSPLKINRVKWEKAFGESPPHREEACAAPESDRTESTEYEWLRVQLRRLDTLPPELAKRLRGSHPLVAEARRSCQEVGTEGEGYKSHAILKGWVRVQRIDPNTRTRISHCRSEVCV